MIYFREMSWIPFNNRAEEKYLFKFLSQESLDRFLDTGSIWFSRADIFADKMECVRIADLKKEIPDFDKIEERKKHFLISCWHLGDKEPLALWDTYSESIEKRRTFAIKFKRADLISLIRDS